MNMLELEIAKERACYKDVIKAINRHFTEGHYDLAKERIKDLGKSVDRIEHMESELKKQRRENLFKVARNLTAKGKKGKGGKNTCAIHLVI